MLTVIHCSGLCNNLKETMNKMFNFRYKMAQTTFLQAEILRKDIEGYEDEVETFAAVGIRDSRER